MTGEAQGRSDEDRPEPDGTVPVSPDPGGPTGAVESSVAEEEGASLFRRDGLYAVAGALQFVGGLLLTPFMTRLLGDEQYGVVVTAAVIMQAVATFAGLRLHTGLQRAYAHIGAARVRRLTACAFVTILVLTAVLDVAGPLWIGLTGLSSYDEVARCAVWWGGASAVLLVQTALLRSEDRLAAFVVVMALQTVLADAAGLGLAWAMSATASVFVLGKLAATLAAMVLGLVLWRPTVFRRRDLPDMRDVLTFSAALVPATVASLIIGSFDRLTIGRVLGSAEAGRYNIAALLGMAPTLVLLMLAESWMPRFFALAVRGDGVSTLVRARDALYRLVPWVVLGLAGVVPFLLQLVAGARFRPEDLTLISVVVSLAVVPEAATAVASRALLSVGRSADVSRGVVAGAVVNLLWNLVAVPWWGLLGAATAAVAGFVVTMVVTARLARDAGYDPPRSRRLPLIAVTSAAALGLTFLPAGVPQIAGCIAAILVAGVLGAREMWNVTR